MNLLPDKIKTWAGLILSVVIVILGAAAEWTDVGPQFVLWTGRAAVLLVVISNVLGLSVPGVRSGVPR